MSMDFDVFISYRRSDGGRGAQMLRRLLQDYRPPKSLRGRAPKYLKVYLDRIYERGTNDFFEGTILPALRSSRNLVILLTPDATDRPDGAADWMRREFEAFEEGPNAGNIIAVLAAGSFENRRPAHLLKRYPNIEIIDMRGLGPLAFVHHDRAVRLADETVKLVAPLLGFGADDMPALRREEERRRQSRLGLATGALAAVVVGSAALTIFALQSRNRAVDALSRSLFAADRIIQSAATSMSAGEKRSQLLMTSCDLLDSLGSEAGRPTSSASLVACARERADARDGVKERAEASAILTRAARSVRTRFEDSKHADDGFALIEVDAAALEHAASAPPSSDLSSSLVAFIAEASEVARTLTDEDEPPRTAAKALQTLAVTLGERRDLSLALRAANGSISVRQISIDRKAKGYESDMADSALVYALKAVLCQRAGDPTGQADALTQAKALLTAIPQSALTDPGVRRRVGRAHDMLARFSSGASR